MFLIIAMMLFSCPATKIVNTTDVWNEIDQTTLIRAKNRCSEIYPKSPCLKRFVKKEENVYTAICG